MFDAIQFQNYKCLADTTIELGRLTLLVGANASGKSSVLDGLHQLCQLGEAPRQGPNVPISRIFGGETGLARLRTQGRSAALRITAQSNGRTALSFDAVRSAAPEEPSAITFETTRDDGTPWVLLSGRATAESSSEFFRELRDRRYANVVRLRLEAARVADFAEDLERPRVEFNGEGTAAVLAWLAEQRDPALAAIEKDLQRVVPRARRIMPSRTTSTDLAGDKVLGRRFSLEMEGGEQIPSDLLSEGTLLTIGLLTVLHRPPVPRLVLLDDFDRALHPTAQRKLVEAVKDVLARNPDLQIVCTTHSPYVLDLFDAEDVRVLRADAKGHTLARKLTEHPEWDSWKGTMKAGEFWSYVGEEWLDELGHAE